MRKTLLTMLALAAMPVCAHAQNLLTNGNFEDSTSALTTPTGWTNIGHTDGVLPYAPDNTSIRPDASYGDHFYSLGGAGNNGNISIGDGIEQTVATTVGNTYQLDFSYTDENCPGCSSVLAVMIGGFEQDYTITADNSGFFRLPFTPTSIAGYVATAASTTISFTLKSESAPGFGIGNNDPMLDKISFIQTAAAGGPGGVPEPAAWALMIVGFGVSGAALRGRRTTRATA